MKENFSVITVSSMTGFAQILTDPAYLNQIVVFTHPHVGLYDYQRELWQSDFITVAGVVARHLSPQWKLWLEEQNVPYATKLQNIKPVSKLLPARHTNIPNTPYLVLWDFGNKRGIQRALELMGMNVLTVGEDQCPLQYSNCLGYVLSSGPGDPKMYTKHLPTIQKILVSKPVLAICLGHQLMGMALGLKVEKMASGHHGSHFPCMDTVKNKAVITAQNHGYGLVEGLLPKPWEFRFRNILDGSIEGLYEPDWGHISTQFHPEGEPGPQDCFYLLDEYVKLVSL